MSGTHTCSTYSRSRHSDEDVVASDLVGLGGSALPGDTTLLALEDGERRHGEGDSSIAADLGANCVVNLVDGVDKVMRIATNGE